MVTRVMYISVRQGQKTEYISVHVRGMGVSAQYGQRTGIRVFTSQAA